LSNDYTHFWDDKPFLKKMAELIPAIAIGGPIVEHLRVNYWTKMRAIAESDPGLRKTMPGMLVAPDRLTVYIGDTHLAIEYFGPAQVPDKLTDDAIKVTFTDYRGQGDFISNIIGMKFEGSTFKLPLSASDLYWNLFVPTSIDATILMMDNGWDMTAENMAFSVNTGGLALPDGDFARMINCFFYNKEGDRLRTRRIQWIDFLPLTIKDIDEDTEDVGVLFWPDMEHTIEHDAHMQFPRPVFFENERLALLNRFRELILTPDITEPQITAWLAEPAHQFILKMALPAIHLLDQRKCAWVTEPSRAAIIPDFFAIKANGFTDIVEFKLPELKGSAVVGKMNREAFSAEVASYVAQTHFYKEYFDDSANRSHVKQGHGIEVYHPKRTLVMGRRWQFENKVWRSVASAYPDLTILTYDDLLDSVTAQLYQNPPSKSG
jgi:hypothetical protein